MSHRFMWDTSINGHTCAQCGMVRPTATPSQSRAVCDALETWQHVTPGALVGHGITANNAPVFKVGISTAQGYAEYRAILDYTGEILTYGYTLNGRPTEEVPATFRKFHAALTIYSTCAMQAYAVAVWAVNMAEDAGECA